MLIEEQARIFKALSSPHRLTIYLRLLECCGAGTLCGTDVSDVDSCVGEIASGLELAPSTVSHHLKELRQTGLIIMEKQGQKSLCHVDPDRLEQLHQFFGDLISRSVERVTKVSL